MPNGICADIILSTILDLLGCLHKLGPPSTLLQNYIPIVSLGPGKSGQTGSEYLDMPNNCNASSEIHADGNNCDLPSVAKRSKSLENSNSNRERHDDEIKNDVVKSFNPPGKKQKKAQTKLFACPYFKHRPWQFCTSRTCSGPGWETVHRVKEHLHRRHIKPIICSRCYNTFDSNQALQSHLELEERCGKISAPRDTLHIGMDEMQIRAIKSRKKLKGSSNEDRWKHMYQILFPEAAHIPCPYYEESDLGHPSRKIHQESIAEAFATYQDQLGKETLRVILAEELPPSHPVLEDGVARVIERIQQAYKNLTADFFKGIVLPSSSLGLQECIAENASFVGLDSHLSQYERDTSAARTIEPKFWRPLTPVSENQSLSSASTEQSSCASTITTYGEDFRDMSLELGFSYSWACEELHEWDLINSTD